MAEYSGTHSLVTPGGTITFNASSGDTYEHDPDDCAGLDMAPLRTPIDQAPQTDGGLVFPFLFDARHVTLGGWMLVRSSGTEPGYSTARNTLEDNLRTALTSIIRADGQYRWTESGMSQRTLVVRCDIPVAFTGMHAKRYAFGLVAANPTWT